ncbi:MAG: sterol desaturase family protein [Methylomonas sp.]
MEEETVVRLSLYIAILLLMIAWEALRPTRQSSLGRPRRWPINLGLAALNVGVMRVSIGATAWFAANWAAEHGVGLFNVLPMPEWLAMVLSFLLLDMAIYAQHIAAHRWRWFWRLHQVHHSDIDFDATTGVRFHPLEIAVSMLYKVVLVYLLGPAPAVVLAFEVILNGCALFNHGNVSIPLQAERYVRYLLVTPDMHRIHHSARRSEMDSNYGFSVSCWDRLFGTYCQQPQVPQTELMIGLKDYRQPGELGLVRLLTMPFRPLHERKP